MFANIRFLLEKILGPLPSITDCKYMYMPPCTTLVVYILPSTAHVLYIPPSTAPVLYIPLIYVYAFQQYPSASTFQSLISLPVLLQYLIILPNLHSCPPVLLYFSSTIYSYKYYSSPSYLSQYCSCTIYLPIYYLSSVHVSQYYSSMINKFLLYLIFKKLSIVALAPELISNHSVLYQNIKYYDKVYCVRMC